MKIPKNKYVRIFLRTVKDLDLTHYLDIEQLHKGCKSEGITEESINSILSVISLPNLLLSLSMPDRIYSSVEIEYNNRIRKEIIDDLCEVVEKSFKGYCYNNININTVDFRLRFATAKNKMLNELKEYTKGLYHLSTSFFYVKIFRGCDITPDGYDPILNKILNEICHGRIK